MEVIRNDDKLKKWTRITQIINIAALVVLGLGMLSSFQGDISRVWVQWLALSIGILLWQIGINLAYRYTRKPRPDEVLDSSLKAAVPGSTLYHYMLPAKHVLLTRSGPIVIQPFINDGNISVSGENGDRWRNKKSIIRRFLSQQPGLGNPTMLVEQEMAKLIAYISENAPELDELPVGAVIVATNPMAVLDVGASRIPVMKASELKKFVRKNTGRALPKADHNRLKEIFGQQDQ